MSERKCEMLAESTNLITKCAEFANGLSVHASGKCDPDTLVANPKGDALVLKTGDLRLVLRRLPFAGALPTLLSH